MAFDLTALADAVARHGRVVRVVMAEIAGSSPREAGAAMLVWQGGQSGTIGGGTLEHGAAQAARRMLAQGDGGGTTRPVLERHALGPDLGQCCGGAVKLLFEAYDADGVAKVQSEAEPGIVARPVAPGAPREMPLAVRRMISAARAQGTRPDPQLIHGWMMEPVHQPQTPVWIWGAGHVGRALVSVLSALPDTEITWIDTARARFPQSGPDGMLILPAAEPARLVPHAPAFARHLIVTYSHALDLELCHHLLSHGFAEAGLIGSATKWARFRKRLSALGHTDAQIARITCPIGRPELGKHPQAIAVGVAAALLEDKARQIATQGKTA
ncbi:MAG: xanthine dehydrogenase accessory protein XdhC [Sediminimonas sp.]|uniref:xanthine dehydrogenase accessory protein XdhC n=1 Tax=Sediminimonas sp. TaxID=2823379 RepID=UPI00286FE554|nr:xanthine dehydrogenase accessory protein XdhC [Sediminimonas sp.]MDR9483554.1 xanthine dehydrogenase accessory protein XdhC [Sediminimonas sp.]